MMLQHKRNLAKRGYNSTKTTRWLKQIKFSTRTSRTLKKTKKNNKNKHTAEDNKPTFRTSRTLKKTKKNNKNKHTAEDNKPTFVTRYCPNSRRAFHIVHRYWTAINSDIPILKWFLSNTPRLAYRANPNLAKRLVRAKLGTTMDGSPKKHTPHDNQDNTGSDKQIAKLANLRYSASMTQQTDKTSSITHCSNKRCPLHTKFIHSQQVRSRVSRRTYNTHGHITCNTPYVVYLIQCTKCNKQYVGQTQKSLKVRFAKHVQAIRDRHRPGTLQEHFRHNSCGGIESITIQLLHRVIPKADDTPERIENILKRLETLWIDRLKCEYPQGLNWARYDQVKRYKHMYD